jgi:hypothetical protein
MNSNNLQNLRKDAEFSDSSERKISEIVGTLERVSAPNDFNFRVKAKIAEEKGTSKNAYRHWLRYVLPVGAAAFVLVFGLYAFNFFQTAVPYEQAENVEPAKVEEIRTPAAEKTPDNTFVAESNTARTADLPADSVIQSNTQPKITAEKPIFTADKSARKKSEIQAKNTPEDTFKGSRDLAREPVSVQILPTGIEPDKSIPPTEGVGNSGKTNIVELLNFVGAEIVTEAGKMKVKSVRQNTLAERAGVKAGDVVESFDEQKSDGNSNSANIGGARKLVVSREGKLHTFDLKLN